MVDNQEAGYSSSLSTMATQPKILSRRRVRAPAPRTPPPPVAIIDLTTDTPTPPPPPLSRTRFPTANSREVERPQYHYEPDDGQHIAENISFPSYQGSYTSFSNEENLGG